MGIKGAGTGIDEASGEEERERHLTSSVLVAPPTDRLSHERERERRDGLGGGGVGEGGFDSSPIPIHFAGARRNGDSTPAYGGGYHGALQRELQQQEHAQRHRNISGVSTIEGSDPVSAEDGEIGGLRQGDGMAAAREEQQRWRDFVGDIEMPPAKR